MVMEIGTTYNFTLAAVFNSTLVAKNLTLTGLDLAENVVGISNVIGEYQRILYSLPDELKNIDIYSEVFAVLKDINGDKIVVPTSFIIDSTIVAQDTINVGIQFTLASPVELARLKKVLSDNLFTYQLS